MKETDFRPRILHVTVDGLPWEVSASFLLDLPGLLRHMFKGQNPGESKQQRRKQHSEEPGQSLSSA